MRTAEEDLMFSLPRELRADLKAAGENTSNKKNGANREHDLR